jgi:hypothetical protein
MVERQLHGDCPPPPEVRDFAGDLFELRIRKERTFTSDWWRGFHKPKKKFLVSVVPARETQRTQMTIASVLPYFSKQKVSSLCA